MNMGIAPRIDGLKWTELHRSLEERGYALTPPLLGANECRELIATFPDDEQFRSHIVMARYRFGRGEYKYFSYPLPEIVQELRESFYLHLATIANGWAEALAS